MLNLYNAPGASASMGGLPSLHGPSHSVGGTDPIPELLSIGNLLAPARANGADLSGHLATASTASVNATAGRDGGSGIEWSPTTTGVISLWPAGNQSAGATPVRPGNIVTWRASVKRTGGAIPTAAARIGWYPGGALATGAWTTVNTDWTEIIHTAVVPDGVTGMQGCLLGQNGAAGENLIVDELGVWIGPGGQWRPPGEMIPALGWRRRSPTGGKDMALEYWDGATWIPIAYDSGWCDISALLEPGWVGTVLVRRTLTELTVHVAPIKFTAAATSDVFWKPPSGWGYPPGVITGGTARYGSIPDGGQATRWAAVTSSGLGLAIQRNVGNVIADVNHWGSVTGPVTSVLPTVLPGVQMFNSSEAIVLPASG